MKDTQIEMDALRSSWIRRFVTACAFCCSIAAVAQPTPVRRIYVEPFTTQDKSEKFRDDVITELRKQSSVSIVPSASGADLILGGGGAIWVRGYTSLNPRSGRSPSAGKPVFGGYLSVELKNANGETLWSDLVTPKDGSENVSQDLAKRIAKHIGEGMEQGSVVTRAPVLSQPQTFLHGAGATFPYPVYSKWFINYKRVNPSLEISYDAVGSETGVRRLLDGAIDFGASDSPEAIRDLAPREEGKYLLLPTVVGGVVPVVNLPGFTGEIQFTPEALAGIYLGTIRKWNDPVLVKANRGQHLPDLDIIVVHRSDGSGTSYAWSDFLSQTSSVWKTKIGTSFAPAWPVGRGANGNEKVAETVKELGGSIGYVEFIYALQNHLNSGKVRNEQGEFVGASLESLAIAAQKAMAISDDLKVSIVNPPGSGAYPIASFTWLVVPAHIADQGKRAALTGFLKWMLGPGQAQAAALGYLALPKEMVEREVRAIASIQ